MYNMNIKHNYYLLHLRDGETAHLDLKTHSGLEIIVSRKLLVEKFAKLYNRPTKYNTCKLLL